MLKIYSIWKSNIKDLIILVFKKNDSIVNIKMQKGFKDSNLMIQF